MDFTLIIYERLPGVLQSQGFSFITVAAYIETKAEAKAKAKVKVEVKVKVKVKGDSAQHQPLFSSQPQPQPFFSSQPEPQPCLTGLLDFTTQHNLSARQAQPFVILRHDVEAKYGNALKIARVQHQMGIRGTYFFRIYPHRGNEEVIREIAALGHEIGYHYDDLSECKGDYEKAIQRFQKNLAYLRQFGPVTSATMEGAPLSKFDNRDLWGKAMGEAEVKAKAEAKVEVEGDSAQLLPDFSVHPQSKPFSSSHPQPQPQPFPSAQPQPQPQPFSSARANFYHYTDFGILTEPYFDVDFNEIFYLTDTGRRWDGWKVSLRDKIPGHQERWIKDGLIFHRTKDIIMAAQQGRLPQKIMITVHPQRWNDSLLAWSKELFWQMVKNFGKRILLSIRK
ncbi:MAG: hypothetical protein AB9834_16235 [Lentimicrobium sp.]